jgi:hypothetical protein
MPSHCLCKIQNNIGDKEHVDINNSTQTDGRQHENNIRRRKEKKIILLLKTNPVSNIPT